MCSDPALQPYLADTVADKLLEAPLPDPLAERVVDCLKREADRQWYIDPNRSVELARRIRRIGEARDDVRQQALGVMTHGDSVKMLGRTAEAWESLERAGALYQSIGDEVGWARTRIGRLHLGTMLNRVAETLADADEAGTILERHGEHERLLRLLFAAGSVHNYLGHPREALARLQRALTLAEPLGDRGEMYLALLSTGAGVAHESLGDLPAAQRCYEQARDFGLAHDEPVNVANAEANLAYILQCQGHYRRALRQLHQAHARVAHLQSVEATKIKWHITECYLDLNRFAEARDLAREVVADYRRFNDAYELARTLLQLATAQAELGEHVEAQRALDEAESLFARIEARSWLATVWLKRGRLALKLEAPSLAAWEAERAAATFAAEQQRVNQANAELLQGLAALRAGDLARVAEVAAQALRTAQQHSLPSLRYTAHLLLGQLAEAQARPERAAWHYRAAASTTERVQRNLTLTLRPGFLEHQTEALQRLIGLHLRGGDSAHAFEALERAKSQVVLGYLANRERLRWATDDPESRQLVEEMEALRARHQWHSRLAHAPREADRPSVVTPLESLKVVADCERQMRVVTEKLYLHTQIGQPANAAPTVALAEVQAALAEDTGLIEYYLDGEHIWAFLVRRDSITARALPLTAARLQDGLNLLQSNIAGALSAGPHTAINRTLMLQAKRVLHRLHAGLLAPLLPQTWRWRRLVVVPYGLLHYLPFHLLYDGAHYLVELGEVVTLPAAGLMVRAGPRRAAGARVLAHSHEQRLPHTRAEAEGVQRRFGGELYTEADATVKVLAAEPCQILHIAAHGEYRLDQPDRSHLHLAEGHIYADDLLQLDLSYELVTLSACETGRARPSGGDELIGLGRGILYAGAGALVASLWQVADHSTLSLMDSFYHHLAQGESKAAALRQAQCAALAGSPELHPAFWGAFQLIGDARRLSL